MVLKRRKKDQQVEKKYQGDCSFCETAIGIKNLTGLCDHSDYPKNVNTALGFKFQCDAKHILHIENLIATVRKCHKKNLSGDKSWDAKINKMLAKTIFNDSLSYLSETKSVRILNNKAYLVEKQYYDNLRQRAAIKGAEIGVRQAKLHFSKASLWKRLSWAFRGKIG